MKFWFSEEGDPPVTRVHAEMNLTELANLITVARESDMAGNSVRMAFRESVVLALKGEDS